MGWLALVPFIVYLLIGVTCVRSDIKSFQIEIRELQKEIKDFHGRLCTIEERIKK
jgi:hypothetical protein